MLAPDLDRVFAGNEAIDHFDRHALLIAGGVKGGGRGGVLKHLRKIGRRGHDQIRILGFADRARFKRADDRLRAEATLQLSQEADLSAAHRYAPPLEAISKTSRTLAARS